jgi:hypothetical protein
MSSFNEVFSKVMDQTTSVLAVATLTSNQVDGVVGVTKAALGPILSEDEDDAYGRYLGTDGSGGVQLFSDRWAGPIPPAGLQEAFVDGQPYDRRHQDNVGLEVHKSQTTGDYRCVVTLASWGNASFALKGGFQADVLVAVGDSVGPDRDAGPAEPAVYTLSMKVVAAPPLNPPAGGVPH